jgi:hypothetical protein
VSQSFGYIPKSGIAGSNGRSMSSFLSSLQIFFQSGGLYSHQQCKRVPFSPHRIDNFACVELNQLISVNHLHYSWYITYFALTFQTGSLLTPVFFWGVG